MNTLLSMVTAVSLDPDDGTAVRALIDLAQEDMELAHAAAVRWAVGVRRQARYDAAHATAAAVLAPDSDYYIDIREECREVLSIPAHGRIVLTQHRRGSALRLCRVPDVVSALYPTGDVYTVSVRTSYALALRDTLDDIERWRDPEDHPVRRRRPERRGGQHDPAA